MILVSQILKEQGEGNGDLADGYVLTGPLIKVLRK